VNNFIKRLKKKLKNSYLKYFIYQLMFLLICSRDFFKIFLLKTKFNKPKGGKKIKPRTIQLALTNRCNLKCKTCNIYMHSNKSLSLIDLKRMVENAFFSKVTNVGVSGGEPFLVKDIEKYIEVLLKLPKIKKISIISNGTLTNIILDKLKLIYKMCKDNNVILNFTVSIDGYKTINDKIRGSEGAFERTIKTYEEIRKNLNNYCDRIGVICTISKHNIFKIKELVAFFKLYNVKNVSYQLAVKHKRLYNENVEDFSILGDNRYKMLAREFFYELFIKTKEKKYYFIYRYLNESFHQKRMSHCGYMDRDITIDGQGNLSYCATKSKIIGHISENNFQRIFFDENNIKYRKELVKNECNSCIHYTNNNGYFKSNLQAYNELRIKYTWYFHYH